MTNQDQEHLRLLSIFHYVVGGLTALCSLFPVFHLVIGLVIIFSPGTFETDGDFPPAFAGWFFVIIAGFFILAGLVLSSCIVISGRFIARRNHHTACLVIAGLECILVPFGTILGVFTLVVLTRDSVRQLFSDRSISRKSDPP